MNKKYSELTTEDIEKQIAELFSKEAFAKHFEVNIYSDEKTYSVQIYGKLFTGIGGFLMFLENDPFISKIIYNGVTLTEEQKIEYITKLKNSNNDNRTIR